MIHAFNMITPMVRKNHNNDFTIFYNDKQHFFKFVSKNKPYYFLTNLGNQRRISTEPLLASQLVEVPRWMFGAFESLWKTQESIRESASKPSKKFV